MSSKRIFYVMAFLTSFLGLSVIGTLVLSNQALHKQSDKLTDVKLTNRLLDEQQTALAAAKKSVQQYNDLEKIARTIVPQDKDQAKAVREIVKIASDSGIKLSSISFPASTLGQVAPKAAPSSDGTTPKVTTPSVTQVKPVDGIPGVFVLEIAVQQDSTSPTTYANFLDFLHRLENNRRTAQVSSVTVQPTPKDRTKLTFSLSVNAYIKP